MFMTYEPAFSQKFLRSSGFIAVLSFSIPVESTSY